MNGVKRALATCHYQLVQEKETNYKCVCIFSRIDGVMRTMSTEKLIKTLPIIQNQLDALLDFQVSVCSTECVCI